MLRKWDKVEGKDGILSYSYQICQKAHFCMPTRLLLAVSFFSTWSSNDDLFCWYFGCARTETLQTQFLTDHIPHFWWSLSFGFPHNMRNATPYSGAISITKAECKLPSNCHLHPPCSFACYSQHCNECTRNHQIFLQNGLSKQILPNGICRNYGRRHDEWAWEYSFTLSQIVA